ncbi:MAG: SH3 domain-containing protein [Chloroflexota bacterium]
MKKIVCFIVVTITLLIAACGTSPATETPTTVPPVQTSVSPTAVMAAVMKIPPTKAATATAKPILIPTQTSFQLLLSTPTPLPGWNTYVNDYLGYQISYPPSMKVHAEGWISFYTDETIPPGFTFDEYFTYLEKILPDQLCVWVESDVGTVTIAPPSESIGRFVSPCPGMGIGEQYGFEDASQSFLVNGRELQISGKKLYLESTGELDSEFYMFNLDNGFRITFISGPAKEQPLEIYPEKMDLLKRVLSTLTWIRIPDLTIPGTTCAGKYTQLLPGVWAQVAPGDPNRVRSTPSRSADVIGQLYPGTASLVVEGPICADGLVFWRVENSTIPGGSGWTAEGDGREYWLEPYEQ